MDDRSALRPVFVRLSDIRVGLHLRQYLIRYHTNFVRVRTNDAECNRKGRIGAKDKLNRPHTGFGSESCGDLLTKTQDELISFLRIRRQDHHLGKVWVRQFGIVGEPETRGASTDIGTDNLCLRLRPYPVLDLDHGGLRRFNAGPLRHRYIYQYFGSVGTRKELLFDQAHSQKRCKEDENDGSGHNEFVFYRPDNHSAQSLIVRRFINRRVSAFHRANVWKEFHTEIWREGNSDNPRGQQSDTDKPKKRSAIIALA